MGLEITGIEDLMQTLQIMASPEFADQALMKGLMRAGKQVQGTAKGLCPVDTGQLRNSIEVLPIENGASVGTNVEYAPYVEYGTGQKGDPDVEHREDWPGVQPRPFLYPALKANEGNVVEIVKNTLQSEINRAVK